MTAAFTDKKLFVYKDNRILLQGARSIISGMWYIELSDQKPVIIQDIHKNILFKNIKAPETIKAPELNNVYKQRKNKDIVTYLSHAIWNPVPKTWINALNKGFLLLGQASLQN